MATAVVALVAPAHHHHFKHHRECATVRCARHADRLWAKHHPVVSTFTGWVIPEAIVMCESKGVNLSPNSADASGYYQILGANSPYGDTWKDNGGGPPYEAYLHSKAEQDRVAARIWAGGSGASQWVCKG